jgi:hypothetical protein
VFLYYTPDDGRTTETCSVRIILVNTSCVERSIKWFVLFSVLNVMDHIKFILRIMIFRNVGIYYLLTLRSIPEAFWSIRSQSVMETEGTLLCRLELAT